MRCHTCDADTDVRTYECSTCRTPVGSPVLHPGARVRPVAGIGRAATVAVGVVVLTYLLTVTVQPVNALRADRADSSTDGENFLLIADLLDLVASTGYLLALVSAAVLVIIWLWRARTNLDAFPGAGSTLAAAWAIAGWLVPIAYLAVPYRVVANVTRESLWRLRTPWLVKLWWGSWLTFLLADQFVTVRATLRSNALPYPETAADFQAYAEHYASTAVAYLVPALAGMAAGASLIVLIHRISAAQTARIARALPAGPILPGMTIPAPAPVRPAVPAPAVPATRSTEAQVGPPSSVPIQAPPTAGGAGGTIGA